MSDRVLLRPGGRSARIQASVHEAVETLSREIGRENLTVPLIANRAGITPSTIYRRWGSLADLLAAVSEQRLFPDQQPPDSGDWRSDLRAWAEQYAEEMTSGPGRRMIHDLVSASDQSSAACRCAQFTASQIGIMRNRAVARGETPPEVDLVMDLVVAPILFRILFDERPIDGAYCKALLDRVG